MAWIDIVPDDDWVSDEALHGLYDRVVDKNHNRIEYIMAVHSLNPRGLAAHDAVYRSAMAGTRELRRVGREHIALVVSLETESHY